MKVDLHMGEWMVNMGLVGLYRVFEYGRKNGIISDEYKDSVTAKPWGIELDTDVLPQLPKAYFLYLLEEYGNKYSSIRKAREKINIYIEEIQTQSEFKKKVKELKKLIEENSKNILEYFPNEELENMLKKLREINRYEHIEQLYDCVQIFQNISVNPKVDQKLTFQNIKDQMLRNFLGQTSFLNNSSRKKDFEEVILKDYITPVLQDLQFEYVLENAQSSDKIISFLSNYRNRSEFKKLEKIWRKLDLEQIHSSSKSYLNKCSVFSDHIAFYNFTESIFYPLGISGENINFSWNFKDDSLVPVSSLAKLVLLFAPAGTVTYSKKERINDEILYKDYSAFVQLDSSFQEIIQKNNHFKQLKQNQEPFDSIVSKLLRPLRKEAEYVVEHLFFIEFSSKYKDRKKTHLHYYHLPMYLAHYFKQHADTLDYIKPYDYREQFVQYVLRGADPIHVIYNYLRDCIKNERSTIGPYIAVRERNRILQFKKGVRDMATTDKTDKRVSALFMQGREIRDAIMRSSGSEKKVTSIAYRLLNAAKAGNRKSFMDTLLRIYMSADRPISPIFLNALHERDLDFATVANAFIAGLLANQYKEEQEEVQA
ncbi:CRISPR-associated protein Cst1 [Anoxybacillus tepidamans]|uniref:CRISPR-associated protein Cst1 n=1 Tax=Anoxybacteroides tepidamans TaxID=265948 RepID=A0A7W8IQH5_9BACL|nr:type I-B CRISPR-associated protein Cas8b1/Cst1 [Anoxybacillus tepidamans]MBB5324876.1 CRISPR-associated protein Cst1 [Anoxybacillus tepidamans]